jgi:release factor glutamine methyltransferase
MTASQAFQQLLAALSTIYDPGEAHSVARIVFEDAFGIRNLQRRDQLAPSQLAQLSRLQARLLNHEPVQYILGQTYFYGLKFKVDRRALIPRQETEELVAWILETIDDFGEKMYRVLDIGTGSGCIAVTLKNERPHLSVTSVDVSREALSLARENAGLHAADIDFQELDILDRTGWPSLPSFDIIVSNPPYIPPSEAHLVPDNVREFEPYQALFTEEVEPLAFYHAIGTFARSHLYQGGFLFFEVNEFRAAKVRDLLKEKEFRDCQVRQDIHGRDRMVRSRWQPLN